MTTHRLGLALLLLGAIAFALAGCGGGGGGGGGPDPDPDPGTTQFDMSGDWLIVVYRRTTPFPDDMDPDEVFFTTVVQSGTSVTVPTPDGGPALTGTVQAATYELARSYPDDGGTTTETVQFDLMTEDEGAGLVTWEWTDGVTDAGGSAEVQVYRLLPPEQSVAGEWDYILSPGLRFPARTVSMPEQGRVTISVNGNEVTFVAPGVMFQGYVTGPHVWLTREGAEDNGQVSETIRLFIGDPAFGDGEVFWGWWDSVDLLTGQDTLNLNRTP